MYMDHDSTLRSSSQSSFCGRTEVMHPIFTLCCMTHTVLHVGGQLQSRVKCQEESLVLLPYMWLLYNLSLSAAPLVRL